MKKIAIFTTFTSADCAYSLNNVVQDQIKMLKRNGYEPVVFVVDGFKSIEAYDLAELRFIPPVHLSNEGKLQPNYQEDVDKMYASLEKLTADIDVCITHDIIYQPAHLIHNIASRKLAENKPNLRWLHWIHSATSPRILCNHEEVNNKIRVKFPNSFICYPNPYEIPRVATNFRTEEKLIKYVPHPIDIPGYFGFHALSTEIVNTYNLLQTDVVMVYPARLDRGKQPQMNVRIAAALKRAGKSVRLIIVDFHSTGGDKVTYRNELKNKATNLGLSNQEVIFTSDFKPETKASVPREVVKDLFLVSNVFILPSVSETYSLVAQEAAMCGNLVCLNFDFTPMRSIYGEDAIYAKFSSNIDAYTGKDGDTNTVYHNGEQYFDELAKKLIYEIGNSRSLALKDKLRKERNLDYVFTNHLEPLLYAE